MHYRQHEETLAHLFQNCNFGRNCWQSIGIQITTRRRPLEAFKYFRKTLNGHVLYGDHILTAWSIWTIRNEWLFNIIDPTGLGMQRQNSACSCIETKIADFQALRYGWSQSLSSVLLFFSFSSFFAFLCTINLLPLVLTYYKQWGFPLLFLKKKGWKYRSFVGHFWMSYILQCEQQLYYTSFLAMASDHLDNKHP